MNKLNIRTQLKQSKRWVLKVGSALLSGQDGQLNQPLVEALAQQIRQLMQEGRQIVVVSSGAVSEGMNVLKLTERPKKLHTLQALAAMGQMRLVHAYESIFAQYGFHTAQVLLTHAEMDNRERYLNAKTTLNTLLKMGVIPIINENDAIANDEIRLGDNDTLAALSVSLIEADALLILTDQKGMYDRDPRMDKEAVLLDQLNPHDPMLDLMVSSKSGVLGSGGMLTKLRAARLCAKSGGHTVIAHGLEDNVITRIAAGEPLGSWFMANELPLSARKNWLLGQTQSKGLLEIDFGAFGALKKGRSLLSIGVSRVDGRFQRGDVVRIMHDGTEIGRGVVNYGEYEAKRICKVDSKSIESVLGYMGPEEMVHKNNLALI